MRSEIGQNGWEGLIPFLMEGTVQYLKLSFYLLDSDQCHLQFALKSDSLSFAIFLFKLPEALPHSNLKFPSIEARILNALHFWISKSESELHRIPSGRSCGQTPLAFVAFCCVTPHLQLSMFGPLTMGVDVGMKEDWSSPLSRRSSVVSPGWLSPYTKPLFVSSDLQFLVFERWQSYCCKFCFI